MIPFVFVGGILFLVGIAIIFGSLGSWRRRQRILGTPTTPIAHARGDSIVEIKGQIVPGEQGVFTTPFSGRPAVFCRVRVQERRQRGKNSYWHTVVEEVDSRDFYIDDRSGQQARIATSTANTILDSGSVASSGTFNDPPPHLMQFLAMRGVTSTTWLGFNKSMQYIEEVLMPGDPIYAIGPSRREAGPPVHDGYRMVPSSRLVMAGMGAGDLELLISNKPEESIARNLAVGMIVGIVFTAIGVVTSIFGLVALVVA